MNSSKLKEGIQLNGNMRNPTWVTRQFSKGRLFIDGTLLTEKTFQEFKIAVKVINDIYEGSWDTEFELRISDKKIQIDIKGLLIHFPEIQIRNKNSNKHQIKNLFIRVNLRIQIDRLALDYIDGARTSLSYAEWQSNYFHSHLSTTSMNITADSKYPYFNGFCTGSGEINIYMADINGEGFSEERFIKFAMQLMTLASYESIEGTPYRYMSNIRDRPSSGRLFMLTSSSHYNFKRQVLDYYKNLGETPNIDITINSQGLYEIANNQKFLNFLTKVSYSNRARYFCLLDPISKVYYSIEGIPGYSMPPVNPNTFIFRNERIKVMEIQTPAIEEDRVVEEELHPSLINNIKKELEYELNKNKIRQSTINRYKIELDNAREGVQSDPILVSTDS